MNYGFVIDNRRCIGCHACSTACKSENDVPLGVFRTWVKTVEHGHYPNVTRSFQVTRCNHCANPPCVRICPTTAMYQRDDGIVEFDSRSCIGCKSCLQACPYDAIYIDPNSGTAAKCHYCGHRTEIGLEPACVVVCPVHAIIAGDMDDPASEISRIAATNKTTVRKPEQGTAPKVLYIDGDDIALHPTVFASGPGDIMAAGDVVTEQGVHRETKPVQAVRTARSGTDIREPGKQGLPADGPLRIGGGRRAEQMVQLNYNAQHKLPWHWPVPAYLVTKAISTGVFLLLALAHVLDWVPWDSNAMLYGGGAAVVFAGLTAVLLIADLERPERFLYILLYPQWKSWLVRGAYLLLAFSLVSGVWWFLELAARLEWMSLSPTLRDVLAWVTIPLALGTSVYTAFLFAQAEGRDLWQSQTLPLHLIFGSVVAGAGALLLVDAAVSLSAPVANFALWVFGAGLIGSALNLLLGELGITPSSDVATRAAHDMTSGSYRAHFWIGAVALGHFVPFVLVVLLPASVAPLAAASAIVGLFLYEYAFVMAPQKVPNS